MRPANRRTLTSVGARESIWAMVRRTCAVIGGTDMSGRLIRWITFLLLGLLAAVLSVPVLDSLDGRRVKKLSRLAFELTDGRIGEPKTERALEVVDAFASRDGPASVLQDSSGTWLLRCRDDSCKERPRAVVLPGLWSALPMATLSRAGHVRLIAFRKGDHSGLYECRQDCRERAIVKSSLTTDRLEDLHLAGLGAGFVLASLDLTRGLSLDACAVAPCRVTQRMASLAEVLAVVPLASQESKAAFFVVRREGWSLIACDLDGCDADRLVWPAVGQLLGGALLSDGRAIAWATTRDALLALECGSAGQCVEQPIRAIGADIDRWFGSSAVDEEGSAWLMLAGDSLAAGKESMLIKCTDGTCRDARAIPLPFKTLGRARLYLDEGNPVVMATYEAGQLLVGRCDDEACTRWESSCFSTPDWDTGEVQPRRCRI